MLLSDVVKRQSRVSVDNGGSASSPSISHNNTANGIFFPAANTVAFATNGAERARITDTGTTQVANFSVTGSGSASLPSISHNGSNNGIFFPAANTVAFATNGAERARITDTGTTQVANFSVTGGGSASSPSISHNNTANGIFFPAANTVAFATNGAERARITDTGTTQVANFSVTGSGSASLPSISHNNTANGIFFPAANTVAFATNGAERARIDSNGQVQMTKTSGWYKHYVVYNNIGTGIIDLAGANSWTWYYNTTYTTGLVVEPGTYDAYTTASAAGYSWMPYMRMSCFFSIDGSTPASGSPEVQISHPSVAANWVGFGSSVTTNITVTSTNNLRLRMGVYSGDYAPGYYGLPSNMSVSPNFPNAYHAGRYSFFSVLLIRK